MRIRTWVELNDTERRRRRLLLRAAVHGAAIGGVIGWLVGLVWWLSR